MCMLIGILASSAPKVVKAPALLYLLAQQQSSGIGYVSRAVNGGIKMPLSDSKRKITLATSGVGGGLLTSLFFVGLYGHCVVESGVISVLF